MKALSILFLLTLSVYAVDIELGPVARLVFPRSEPPVSFQTLSDFDGVFVLDGPQVLLGARIRIDLIRGIPLEVSGLFGEYEPYFEQSEVPDSIQILFSDGSLSIMSIGLSKRFGEISILGGSDLHAFRETWMEVDGTGWGGYHRQNSLTILAPYVGTGIESSIFGSRLSVDARLLFPKLEDIWISIDLSILFN